MDFPTFPSTINFSIHCIVTENSSFAWFESIYSRLIFWPNIWSILENVPRALVKSMESVCLCPGHTCPSSTVLRGQSPLTVGHGCWVGQPFSCITNRGDHWDKRDTFLSAGDSEYPILWQIGQECALVRPGILSQTHPLATFSETGKFSPAKGLAQIQTQFSSVTQSSPTLCDPMDCSMPGLPVHH